MAHPVLPFTGERYTPECALEIATEHWHRYAFARALAPGRRVLDAACGEGYGSALMARAGGDVLGLDIGADAVAHARTRYAGVAGLRFEQADATALQGYADASFDLVLSFETLEHVQAQAQMLDGFARLLAPGGLLLVSTPDKRTYTDLTGQVNPHHVRELYRGEFEALVRARFPATRLYGQKNLFQSVLWSLDGQGGVAQASTLAADDEVLDGVGPAPMYFLAACARSEAELATLPALSLFGDAVESVYADYRAEIVRGRAAALHIAHLEAELARLRGGA